MNAHRTARAVSLVVALLSIPTQDSSAQSTARPSSSPGGLPQTQWADEFGRALADRLVQEAKAKRPAGHSGPVEVTVKFTVSPFAPKIEKPTWTPDDVKNLDVCAQVCSSWGCYLNCSAPKVPPVTVVLPVKGVCDGIREKYLKELVANNCLGFAPKK